MISTSKQVLKKGIHVSRNARDWIGLADHLIQAERTEFDVIYQEDIERLRHYRPLQEEFITVNGETVVVEKNRHATPLVIVAPLAVNMYIYDMFQTRSFVKFMLAKGFDVYLVDWGKPTTAQNHYHLSTYFGEILPRMLAKVREHSGSQKISLHGWSMGGIFSYCYAAQSQDQDIENIVLVGAPCDYHASGDIGKIYQKISKQFKTAERLTGFRVHKTKRRYWRSPGWANMLSFKMTNPVGSVQGYMSLLRNLTDRSYVSSHATNAAFLDRMEAYPGGVIQDVVQYLMVDNIMAEGKLPMSGTPKSLANISANVISITGAQDPLCTPKGAYHLFDLIGSVDKKELVVPGGHMGILGGSAAPENSWYELAEWLSPRSKGKALAN